MDETMRGETMAFNFINKINNKLKFLHHKNSFLTPALRRLLSYTALFWLGMFCLISKATVTKKINHIIQTTQNKCMSFCLYLDKLKHISHEEFEHLNWLPMTYRFKQSVNSVVFKYFNEQCPDYLSEVFNVATERNLN